jgi:type VI secretion system protein ImpK
MIAVRQPGSFLLNRFREFYREVVRLKRTVEFTAPLSAAEEMVTHGPLLVAGAAIGGGRSTFTSTFPATSEPGPAVTNVWQQLLTLLERQSMEAGQGGAFAYEVYREAQYVMAALADEVFLHLEWEGKSRWPLLESRLFQTHIAGEEIFARIDRLLQRRDPFYLDLAAVYFMALSLGFQGKYRGCEERERMEYRRQLFQTIYRREPKLFGGVAALFPQTLQHTLDKVDVKRLPAQWTWLWLIAGVLVMWVAASQYTWSSVTSRASCLICQATQQNCACDPGASK